MNAFLVGHATHPDWRGALALAAAPVEARRAAREASARGGKRPAPPHVLTPEP